MRLKGADSVSSRFGAYITLSTSHPEPNLNDMPSKNHLPKRLQIWMATNTGPVYLALESTKVSYPRSWLGR